VTLLQRTILMLSLLLAATVAATALTLAADARQRLLDQTALEGMQLARVLARGAQFAQDVPGQVDQALGDQMLAEATLAAHLVATAERSGLSPEEINRMLKAIADETVLDELWITDSQGHAYLRNQEDIDFTFDPDPAVQPQASAFWPLLTGERDAVVQDARVREVDDQVFKYAGVAGIDKPRIVQVGFNAALLAKLREQVGLPRLVAELVKGAPDSAATTAESADVAAIHVVDKDLVTLAYSAAPGHAAGAELSAADEANIRRVVATGEPLSVVDDGVLKVFAAIGDGGSEVDGVALVMLPTAPVNRAVGELVRLSALLAGAVLLAGLVASVVLARRVTGPVEQVTAAARAIEAGSYRSESLALVAERRDELGQLARVFRQMADEVAAREARLERQIQALTIQIDQQKRVRQVSEITGTDYFRELRRRGQELRQSSTDQARDESAGPE
jgi:HAMP domain-containing protein